MSLLQIDAIPGRAPAQPLLHLDALWLQVAGTLCNLSCGHCFVSCGPTNHHHPLMSRDEVRTHVRDALALGARELYFTGGEPFLHPEVVEILEECLSVAPCTVLTNGTLFTPDRIVALTRLSEGSAYSLELRVSLDGWRAADHDRIRGAGAFERAMQGLVALSVAGLLPIVTATYGPAEEPSALTGRYRDVLRAAGIRRPRLKLLPMFQLGREIERTRPYQPVESLVGAAADSIEPGKLQCAHCRAVSARGVFVCPLLVEEPGGRMGSRLGDALGPFELRHGACFTCAVTGMTCSNG